MCYRLRQTDDRRHIVSKTRLNGRPKTVCKRLSVPYTRYRGDMIEVLKYLRGTYSVRSNDLLPRAPVTALRGHDHKLLKRHCRSRVRSSFFSYRVVTSWNNLPNEVVSAPSLNSFKGRLDKYWKDLLLSVSWHICSTAGEQPTGQPGLTSKAEEEGKGKGNQCSYTV